MTKRIVVGVDKANDFIDRMNRLTAKFGLFAEYHDYGYEVSVNLKPLLLPRYVEVEEEKELTKSLKVDKKSSQNEINIAVFKDAIDKLEGKNRNLKFMKASEITGIGNTSLSTLYYVKESTKTVTQKTYAAINKLYDYHSFNEHRAEAAAEVEEIEKRMPLKKKSNKNDIMIRRVAKALNTDDPDAIAKKITSSVNILNQTDFSNYDDVIDYMKRIDES